MRKQFNHHRPFLVHKHGRRSIVLYISMAAVTSCENDLPPFSPVVPRTAELPRLQLFPFLSIFVKLKVSDFSGCVVKIIYRYQQKSSIFGQR